MITKQTAALLFAHGFRLVDKEWKEYTIQSVHDGWMYGEEVGDYKCITINFESIGTDYWILKRPYSQLKIIIGDDEVIVYNRLWGRSKLDFDTYGENASFHMWAYEDIVKLHKHHFIDLPEGTYREIYQ